MDETIQGLYQLLIVTPIGVNVTVSSFKCNVNSEHVVSPLVGGVYIIRFSFIICSQLFEIVFVNSIEIFLYGAELPFIVNMSKAISYKRLY